MEVDRMKSGSEAMFSGVAVCGILLLVFGIALCFMPISHAQTISYYPTYPYRESGLAISVIGIIMGVGGFAGFSYSRGK
jgi:uncharacterized membrane protein